MCLAGQLSQTVAILLLLTHDCLTFGLDDALLLRFDSTDPVVDQSAAVAEHAVVVADIGLEDHRHYDFPDQLLKLGVSLVLPDQILRALALSWHWISNFSHRDPTGLSSSLP